MLYNCVFSPTLQTLSDVTLHSLNYGRQPLVGLVSFQFISQDLQKKKELKEQLCILEQRD